MALVAQTLEAQPSQTRLKTAVVLLNWNGRHWLERFVPEILGSLNGLAELVVIDNASTDDSKAWLDAHHPGIRWIQNGENLGYAGGYTRGLEHLDAELLVLMNTDVCPRKAWLEPLIEAFERQPLLGAAQPRILDHAQSEKFEYAGAAGGFIDALGYPFCRGRLFDDLEEEAGKYLKSGSVFWASGACLAVRASVFRALGGFEASFFAHFEEIDLCWRIQRAGYALIYLPDSVVEHVGGGTLSQLNPKKTFLNFRNNLMCLARNESLPKLLWLLPLRLILDGLAGLRLIGRGQFDHCWAIVKAHFAFYGLLGQISRYRKNDPFTRRKKLRGVYPKSILWAYFAKGVKSFDALGWDPDLVD